MPVDPLIAGGGVQNAQFGDNFVNAMQTGRNNQRQNALLEIDQQRADAYSQSIQDQRATADRNQKKALVMSALQRYDANPAAFPQEALPHLGAGLEEVLGQGASSALQDEAVRARMLGKAEAPGPLTMTNFGGGARGLVQDGKVVGGVKWPDAPKDPRAEPAPSFTEIVDPTNPKQMLRIDGRVYRGGGLGSPGVIGVSGKEPAAAVADAKRGTGKDAVTSLVVELKDLYQQLDEANSIVSPKRGSVSNLMSRIGASSAGQLVQGAIGTETQRIRDEIVQKRPQLLNAIRQASGMSARAIDSNAELKLWLDAVSDPARAYESNVSILDQIDSQYGTGGNNAPQETSPIPEGVPPEVWAVMTPEEKGLWQK